MPQCLPYDPYSRSGRALSLLAKLIQEECTTSFERRDAEERLPVPDELAELLY